MEDHSDQHIFAQEVQIIPIEEDEETEWEGFPQSKDVH